MCAVTGSKANRLGMVGLGSVLQAKFALCPRAHAPTGHIRLANGTKAVDLLAENGKPRSVLLAWQCRFDHENNLRSCSVILCAKATLCTDIGFFRFYYEVFAEHLQTLSKKFLPETDAAIQELLSFRVEVEVIAPIPEYTWIILNTYQNHGWCFLNAAIFRQEAGADHSAARAALESMDHAGCFLSSQGGSNPC